MHWPGKQPVTGRGVRRIPLFEAVRAAGAAMGQAAGWERANWFEPGTVDPEVRYSFDDPSWFPAVRDEVRATREGVALYDLSTYAKFLVQGPEAVSGLQRLCTSNVDVAAGRIVYTLLCNERGGIEMDPTVTRLGEDTFMVLAPTLYQRRTEMLLRSGLPAGATVTDVTSGWATLHWPAPARASCWPGSRTRTCRTRPSRSCGRRRSRSRAPERGRTASRSPASSAGSCRCRRSSSPTCTSGSCAAGESLGLRHAGAFAFDAARTERGFRSWGHDIGQMDDPYASGLAFAVSSKKTEDFVGREALAALRSRLSASGRWCRVHAPDAVLWHGESILRGERARRASDLGRDRADARGIGRPRLGARRPRGRRLGRRDPRRGRAGGRAGRAVLRSARRTAAQLMARRGSPSSACRSTPSGAPAAQSSRPRRSARPAATRGCGR